MLTYEERLKRLRAQLRESNKRLESQIRDTSAAMVMLREEEHKNTSITEKYEEELKANEMEIEKLKNAIWKTDKEVERLKKELDREHARTSAAVDAVEEAGTAMGLTSRVSIRLLDMIDDIERKRMLSKTVVIRDSSKKVDLG